MRQILPGIHTWSVFSQDKGLDFNGHLVVGRNDCVLIDPPAMTDEEALEAERLGPPSAVIITNCHHTRDAMTFARRWHIPILLPEGDVDPLPATVRLGGVYRDGDRLAAGLVAVTLTGQKSPGESALLCPAAGAVILGDALIGKPTGRLSLLPPDKYVDVSKAREGLRRLLDHPFDAVLVGDGASLPVGGRAILRAFLEAA